MLYLYICTYRRSSNVFRLCAYDVYRRQKEKNGYVGDRNGRGVREISGSEWQKKRRSHVTFFVFISVLLRTLATSKSHDFTTFSPSHGIVCMCLHTDEV